MDHSYSLPMKSENLPIEARLLTKEGKYFALPFDGRLKKFQFQPLGAHGSSVLLLEYRQLSPFTSVAI